jgi:hypothetical protein
MKKGGPAGPPFLHLFDGSAQFATTQRWVLTPVEAPTEIV